MNLTILSLYAFTVTLSADAEPIPGGYVVPERGNVTFTCNSSSGGYPLWRVNLTDMNDIDSLVTAYNLNGVNGFNSSDEPTANPASFTFHNIFFNSRTSIVECLNSNDISEVSRAIILAQGKGTIINNVIQYKWGIQKIPSPCSFAICIILDLLTASILYSS